MGLETHLILEVTRDPSEGWTGFQRAVLCIWEPIGRDRPFLEALGLHPDQIEHHPIGTQRGLPNDASDLTLQEACQVDFQGGGVHTDIDAPNGQEDIRGTTLVTRNGVVFVCCREGFCRNHSWLSLDELIKSLEHYKISMDDLERYPSKLLERARDFQSKGFEVRFVGWVCN